MTCFVPWTPPFDEGRDFDWIRLPHSAAHEMTEVLGLWNTKCIIALFLLELAIP